MRHTLEATKQREPRWRPDGDLAASLADGRQRHLQYLVREQTS